MEGRRVEDEEGNEGRGKGMTRSGISFSFPLSKSYNFSKYFLFQDFLSKIIGLISVILLLLPHPFLPSFVIIPLLPLPSSIQLLFLFQFLVIHLLLSHLSPFPSVIPLSILLPFPPLSSLSPPAANRTPFPSLLRALLCLPLLLSPINVVSSLFNLICTGKYSCLSQSCSQLPPQP